MKGFAILFSYAQTAKKNGMLPVNAILCKLKNPNWNVFGDGGEESASDGPSTVRPDDETPDVASPETVETAPETAPETVETARPEAAQPAESETNGSPDETGNSPEKDVADNQAMYDTLSDTSKLVFCAYAMALLLESCPRMYAEWSACYSRARQSPTYLCGQVLPYLPPSVHHEHPVTEVGGSPVSLTNQSLLSVAGCVTCAAQDKLACVLSCRAW